MEELDKIKEYLDKNIGVEPEKIKNTIKEETKKEAAKVEEKVTKVVKEIKKTKKKVVDQVKEEEKARRDKLNSRIKKLNATKKFNILPDIDIDAEEQKVLKAIAGDAKFDYTSLCRALDCKPSKLDKLLKKLEAKEMIVYTETRKELTDLGSIFASRGKDKKNRNKKFQKFVEILSDEEFDEFVEAVKSLKISIK